MGISSGNKAVNCCFLDETLQAIASVEKGHAVFGQASERRQHKASRSRKIIRGAPFSLNDEFNKEIDTMFLYSMVWSD